MGYGIKFLNEAFNVTPIGEYFKELDEELYDEYKGALDYARLSFVTTNQNEKDMLIGMARDEHRHAKNIEYILKSNGMYHETDNLITLRNKADTTINTL
jgi:hypothetical protein